MKVEQLLRQPGQPWQHRGGSLAGSSAQFVLVFGQREILVESSVADLRTRYPGARLIFASTSGEISGTEISEGTVCATAVALEKNTVVCAAAPIAAATDSRACGATLGRALLQPDLVHVFVLCDGSHTNGTEFITGLAAELPAHVRITGGLAGDGTQFQRTVVGLDHLTDQPTIVALGFCGAHLDITYGCEGGWAAFGPERVITRAEGNQLFELDGRSALALYKQYLGEQAAGLPGTAMQFPLTVHAPGSPFPLVRTILALDETTGCMTFAGDMPVGSRVRLMRASQEDLIDGAAKAAGLASPKEPTLIICVSCVGRRIVLGQRTEEEIEIVRDSIGGTPMITGFYSYGELAPTEAGGSCQLHNQTMTLTLLRET